MIPEPETEEELAADAAARLLALSEPRRHNWVTGDVEKIPQAPSAKAADGVSGFTREGLRMVREASLVLCTECGDVLKSRTGEVSKVRACPGVDG